MESRGLLIPIGQILAMIGLAFSLAYWGGHADQLLKQLTMSSKDHEIRLRCVEHEHRNCP